MIDQPSSGIIYREVAAPTSLPITLQQVKAWTKVDDAASDAELSGLIQAATLVAENYCNRPLMSRQFDAVMDGFPWQGYPYIICLNKLPVQSVESITYLDNNGVSQVLDPANYLVALGNDFTPTRITPGYNQAWPGTRYQLESVTVRFTAGYAGWNSVPESIRQGIAYLVEHYYDNRDMMDKIDQVNPVVAALFGAHRVYSL